MNEQSGPRLGLQVDTSGIGRLVVAAGQLVDKLKPLGDHADAASQRLDKTGKAAAATATASTSAAAGLEKINAQLLSMGRQAAGANASLDEMARALLRTGAATDSARVKADDYFRTLQRLKAAQADEHLKAQASAAEGAAMKMGLLQGAVGGLTAAIGFQFVGAINAALTGLARIPVETAYAADRLTTTTAKLSFAFRGNVDTARAAYRDIVEIAQRTGAPLQDLSRSYSEIAVSARGTGLSQRDVTGTVSAFQNLGQISGAGPVQVNGAIYQFQQALSRGQLQFQDYRYILNNMPAFDVALSKGLGITPSELLQQVSAGTIDSQRMVRGFIEGAKIIERESGGIPETVERSQNRLKNEWEMTLQAMGKSINSTGILQAWNTMLADVVKSIRDSRGQDQGGFVGLGMLGYIDPEYAASAAAKQRRDAAAEKERQQNDEYTAYTELLTNIAGTASQGNSVRLRQRQLDAEIKKLVDYLRYPAGQSQEQIETVRLQLAALQGQRSLTMSGLDRFNRDTGNLGIDGRFGPTAANMRAQARQMVEASIGEGAPISLEAALAAIQRREVQSSGFARDGALAEVDARRRLLFPSIGGTPRDRANAEVELRIDALRRSGAPAAVIENERRVATAQAEARLEEQLLTFTREAAKADRERQELGERRLEITARTRREYEIQSRILERIAEYQRQTGMAPSAAQVSEFEQSARRDDAINDSLRKQTRAMDRLERIGTSTANAIGGAFDRALTDAFEKGRISLENLGKIAEGLALDIMSQITRKAIADPIADAASSGIKAFFSRMFAADGAAFDGGMRMFAAGGVVSRPTMFAYGGGVGLMGEAGSEAILPLRRGTDGRLGVGAGGGGGDTQVIVNDMRGQNAEPVEVQSRRGSDGKRMVEIMVRDTVNKGFSQGNFDGAMRGRYGQARVIKQV